MRYHKINPERYPGELFHQASSFGKPSCRKQMSPGVSLYEDKWGKGPIKRC